MGSSLNNADTDFSQDVYSPEVKLFDVVCPQLLGSKPNSYQSACDIRLAMLKIPRGCRTCQGIVTAKKTKPPYKNYGDVVENPSLVPCACGNERESGCVLCPKCKAAKDLKRKEYRKVWYEKRRDAQNKLCGICDGELENKKHKYCDPCKPEAKRQQKVRSNKRRVLERKQIKEMKA